MAGAKRKLDTVHGPTAEGASHATTNGQNVRVTRSATSQANRDPRGTDRNHNNTTPSRRSRIIKLNTRGALANNASPSNARETRTSRGQRAAAPPSSTNQPQPPASAPVPETPRVKRIKRGSVAEETPRSTRQSARLRAQSSSFDEAEEGKPLEPSPSKGETEDQTNVDSTATDAKSPSPEEAIPEIPQESQSGDPDVLEDPNPEDPNPEDPKESNPAEETNANQDQDNKPVGLPDKPPPPSPPESEKQKSPEAEDSVAAGSADASTTSPNKKRKLEETDLDRALEQQLQNGMAEKHDSQSAADVTEESRVDDESRQITDVEESIAPNGVEPTTKPAANSRGASGRAAAARGRAKGKGRPKGKAIAGRATGRGRQIESPEARPERSPSPSAAARKLLDRKLELDRAFKKVAAAQRLALHVMAVRTERQLARDKNAHKKVPEFEELDAVLKAYRQRRQDIVRREYEYRVAQEELLFASDKDRIEKKFRSSARNIQGEHLLAAQGDYMSFVEGRRAAEDDEHTETDGSDSESQKRPVKQPIKEFIRGFNSKFVRELAGAAAYERASTGWEDFVQRARLGEDIDPQMKEMRETNDGGAATKPAPGALDMLLEATGFVANQPVATNPHREVPVAPAVALSALADVASSEAPIRKPRSSIVHTLFPQPMADPRTYMLPRPAPPPLPPRQQPRPLLPAGQPIPSINEQLGLPDPFSSGGGPPQLPPPPGSNFQRPPPPGFLQGNPLCFPPPPPPRHPY